MSILNEDIWYEIRENKVVFNRDIYTELCYRVHKLEKENQQLKKQKDDVVEYMKKHTKVKVMFEDEIDEILRMLGEIE